MVRIKYRYIAIQIISEPKVILSQDSYWKIIYDQVFENYGLKTALLLKSLSVIELLEKSNICIFKVLRDISSNVCKSIEVCKNLNALPVEIKILSVSSSVKGIKGKVTKIFHKQQTVIAKEV